MNVQQTTQLIQLVLNSILMINVCVLALMVLLPRHREVYQQFYPLIQSGQPGQAPPAPDRAGNPAAPPRPGAAGLTLLKATWHRYRLVNASLFSLHYGLLAFAASALLLVGRAVVDWQGLIFASLLLFLVGMIFFLGAIGLMLWEFYCYDGTLWPIRLQFQPAAIRRSSRRRGSRSPEHLPATISLEKP